LSHARRYGRALRRAPELFNCNAARTRRLASLAQRDDQTRWR